MVHYEHDKCNRIAISADKSHAKQLKPSQQNWNESVKHELKYMASQQAKHFFPMVQTGRKPTNLMYQAESWSDQASVSVIKEH